MEEMRKAVRERYRPALWYALERDPELASRIVAEIFEKMLDIIREGDEKLRERIEETDNRLRERIEESDKRLRERIEEVDRRLGERIEKNAEMLAELGRKLDELGERVEALRASLEAEREIRKGEVGRLEGRIIETRLITSLISWCEPHGLHVEPLPREPYRVDAVVEGEHVLALVEIAKTGAEADIEQLLEGARIYERIRGERPNALVLFIYAERSPKWLLEEAEEHDIIVENSPKRIAKRLSDLEERLRRGE